MSHGGNPAPGDFIQIAAYDASLFQDKADAVFAHIFDSYWDDGHSVYSPAA